MSLLGNVNVFCVSPAGVTEGSQFLTLVTCRPSSVSFVRRDASAKKRIRTSSLPSELEEVPPYWEQETGDKNGRGKTQRQGQLIRRSLSADILRDRRRGGSSRAASLEDVCRACIRSMMKGSSSGGRSSRRKLNKKKKVAGGRRKRNTSAPCKSLQKCHNAGLQSPGTAFRVDGYMLSYFIAAIKQSSTFRLACIDHWSKHSGVIRGPKMGQNLVVVVALMSSPKTEVLDLLGNKMVNSNILFRRSLEHALSWLSTLGGAFSALGDLSPAFAEEAGNVSLTQLRIAMKLDDPGIKSRCRLYAAISLLQKGFLRSCRDIVRNEYKYAMSLPEGADPRLRRMCLGIWAKLQYHWKLAAAGAGGKKMILKSTSDGLEDIRNNAKYWNMYNLEENRKLVEAPAPLPDAESLL